MMLVSPYPDNAGVSGLGSEQVWGWKGPGSRRWTAYPRCHKETGRCSVRSGGKGYLSAGIGKKKGRERVWVWNNGYTGKLLSGTEAESSRHNTHRRDITHSSGANASTQANETFQGVSLKSIPLSKHSIQLPSHSILCMCVCVWERNAVI